MRSPRRCSSVSDTDEIGQAVAAATEHGAAILVAKPVDTIKEVNEGRVVRTLNRNDLRHALTPQCFTINCCDAHMSRWT